jgi:TIR domain
VKSIFFSYSHKDESLRNQLETHLAMLKRQGVISVWHDRRLVAGDHVDDGIAKELDAADIILLLEQGPIPQPKLDEG